jgi:hypothetical protein
MSGRITLPRRPRGRPSAETNAAYEAAVAEFCRQIREIKSTLDFAVSSRGWCYILEEHISPLIADPTVSGVEV